MERAEWIKFIWLEAIWHAPEGALEGPDGKIMEIMDVAAHDGTTIVFEKITYGEHKVVEAEGVVVCRL